MTAAPPAIEIEGSASARHWKVHFYDDLVKITVNRLVDEAKSLWAELTVTANLPGVAYPWAQIHHEGMNLLTGAAKKRLAKALTDLYPTGIAWTTIIDKTAELVIEKHRQGEPVIQLKDLPPKESLSYRVAPLLVENQPTLLYGLGGKGKSLVSQYLACLVSEGYPVGNLLPEPGPVLICDYETDQDTVGRNLTMIHKGLGIEEGSSIFYRRMGQPLVNEIESIQGQVLEHGIQMVIVDSAGPAVGGGAESAEGAIKYFSALRNLNTTTLTVAHKAKNTDNGPFGSVFWTNVARNVYRLQSESESENRLHCGMFNEKSNFKKQAPFGLRVDFEDDKITFTEENPKTRPEMMEHLSLGDQLEATIKETNGRPWTVKDLAEALSQKSDSVRTTLHRGKSFTQLQDGSWGLAVRIGEHNGHNT